MWFFFWMILKKSTILDVGTLFVINLFSKVVLQVERTCSTCTWTVINYLCSNKPNFLGETILPHASAAEKLGECVVIKNYQSSNWKYNHWINSLKGMKIFDAVCHTSTSTTTAIRDRMEVEKCQNIGKKIVDGPSQRNGYNLGARWLYYLKNKVWQYYHKSYGLLDTLNIQNGCNTNFFNNVCSFLVV